MPITREQFKKSLYFSVFKVIRMQNPPTMEDFMEMKNSVILSLVTEASPEEWSSFWQEILADTIEKDLRAKYRVIIDNFDYSWFDEQNKTIQDLLDYAERNIIDL